MTPASTQREILRLHKGGWSSRRIAFALGVSRNTVRRYLRTGEVSEPRRKRKLDPYQAQLEALVREGLTAEQIRRKLGVGVSTRTIQRAAAEYRRPSVIVHFASGVTRGFRSDEPIDPSLGPIQSASFLAAPTAQLALSIALLAQGVQSWTLHGKQQVLAHLWAYLRRHL